MATFYWVGNDGNVYVKQPSGKAANVGQFLGNNPNGGYKAKDASGNVFFSKGTQVENPSNAGQSAVSGSGGPVQAGSGAAPTGITDLDRASIRATEANINQLGPLLQAALASEDQRYRNTTGAFDAQEKQQRDTYDQSTVTNQQNYDSNYMASLRAGVKGLRGLMAVLRGTGMEGWARGVVGDEVSSDVQKGLDTRNENQGQLDSSLSSFVTDLQRRRQEAGDTYENNKRAVTRENRSTLQDLYNKLAGIYSGAGDSASAGGWVQRAAALTPEIAANQRTQVSAYNNAPIEVKAADISAFAAPEDRAISASGGDGQLGSGIFALTDRRKKDSTVAPVAPVGA